MKLKNNNKFLNGLKRIVYKDSSYATLRFKSGFPNGDWVMVNKNGKYEFIGSYRKGEKHGLQTYFYSDGNKRLVVNFVNGYQEGKTLMYYPNGKLGGEFFCVKGKKHGIEKWFDFEGKIIWKEYYIKGMKIDSVNFFKNFKLN